MGAWGLGLFQSDHDLDIIAELDFQAGFWLVESLAGFMDDQISPLLTPKQKKKHKKQIKEDPSKDMGKMKCSLYAEQASSAQFVRSYIESGPNSNNPTVTEMTARFTAEINAQRPHLGNPYGAAYKTVIFGACLMTLGCDLPHSFTALLKEIYPKVGLMRIGLAQMKKALGKKGYKNGQPYKFGSVSQDDVTSMGGPPAEDWLYPGSKVFNVPAPNEAATAEQLAGLKDDQRKAVEQEQAMLWALGHRGEMVCASCKKAANGSQLQACGSCKGVRYCDRKCQLSDWVVHKRVCLSIKGNMDLDATVFVGNRGTCRGMKDSIMAQLINKDGNSTTGGGSSVGQTSGRVEEVDSDGETVEKEEDETVVI